MVSQIERSFIDSHPLSAARAEKARLLFPGGVTHDSRRQHPFQLYYTHASGTHKHDVDGNEYIDFWSGHGSLILGHSHPEIVQAVQQQMSKGTHLSGSSDLEMEWAAHVIDLIPSAEKVRFHSSGTEADMMALRMARAYTQKSKIIKFKDHFHGWNDYLVADGDGLGGIPKETLSTVLVLPANDTQTLEKTLKEDSDIAAIIIEPTGAHMGLEPVLPSFLEDLRRLSSEYGIVLIFDEVVTGFRISSGGAQKYYGVTPDLTTLAKILGGGLPGGAVCGKADIINMIETKDDPEYNKYRRVGHNGTFNANPLSASAGVTALGILKRDPINEQAISNGNLLKKQLNEILTQNEVSGCASGVNSLIHLRIGADHNCDSEICILPEDEMKKTTNANRNAQLNLAMLNNGIHSGTRFVVGAFHTENDIFRTAEAFDKSLRELRSEGLI